MKIVGFDEGMRRMAAERAAFEAAHSNAAVSIRWRKASATTVIYVSGRVLESGFESATEALDFLSEKYPAFAARAKIVNC